MVKESTCQLRSHRRHEIDPWVGRIPWRTKWQPTPVFLECWDRKTWWSIVHGVAQSQTRLSHWTTCSHHPDGDGGHAQKASRPPGALAATLWTGYQELKLDLGIDMPNSSSHLAESTFIDRASSVEMQVWSQGGEDPLEEGMATHSSILAWRIPWTEEPGRLQPVGSQRVRHNWACLTIVVIPYIRSTELIFLVIETLYTLTSISHFLPPRPPRVPATTILLSASVSLTFLDGSQIVQYLSFGVWLISVSIISIFSFFSFCSRGDL